MRDCMKMKGREGNHGGTKKNARQKYIMKTSKEVRLTSNKFFLENRHEAEWKKKKEETTSFIIEYFSHFSSRD